MLCAFQSRFSLLSVLALSWQFVEMTEVQANAGCYFQDFKMFGYGASGSQTPAQCLTQCSYYGNQNALKPGRCFQFDSTGNLVTLATYTLEKRCSDELSVPFPFYNSLPSESEIFNALRDTIRSVNLMIPRPALSHWFNINQCRFGENEANNFQLEIKFEPQSDSEPARIRISFRRLDEALAIPPRVFKAEAVVAESNLTDNQHDICRNWGSGCPVDLQLYSYTRWAVGGEFPVEGVLEQSNLMFHNYQLRLMAKLVKNSLPNSSSVKLNSGWSRTSDGFTTTGSYLTE